jgi:hypothetical protein
MDTQEWLSEVSSPTKGSKVSFSSLSRDLAFYQSEIVSLEKITSPADARIVYTALRSLGEVQGQPFVPRTWEKFIGYLLRSEPTRRQELTARVAEAVKQVFCLQVPEGGPRPAGLGKESPPDADLPLTTFSMLNDLQFFIIGILDIKSRCRFACTSKANRALVQTWRKMETEKFLSNEKRRKLIPFFLAHAPRVIHPEFLDLWPSEWFSRVYPAIIQQINTSQILLSSERPTLLQPEGQNEKEDFKTLEDLLQTSYDISFIAAFQSIASPWIDIANFMFISGKLDTTEKFFQQLGDSYERSSRLLEFDFSSSNMTCIPEQLFLRIPLQTLNLSNNRILVLPESLQFSLKLSRLVLQHNSLVNIPDFIGRMSQLTVLDLSYNQLQTLPESFGSLINLEELDLSGNPIACLPTSFRSLHHLRTLRLIHVNLNASFCQKLPPEVNVFIDSRYRFHLIDRYKMFPHGVHIHFVAA